MNDLYVYYRVRDARAAQLLQRLRAMHAALADAHGIIGQIKRRPGSHEGVQTWMEIYPSTGGGFDAVLERAVRDAALAELIDGPRHTEVFTDVETCA